MKVSFVNALGLAAPMVLFSAGALANGDTPMESPSVSAVQATTAEPSPEVPTTVAEFLAQGRRYAEFHQFELALPLLQKAVELNPIDIEAQVALGGALVEDVSVELLSQARLKSPQSVTSIKLNDAQAMGRAVRSCELTPLLAERITRGEQNILVALKLDNRKNREALSRMGQIEFIRQDWEKAKRSFTAIVRMNSADIEGGRWLKETEYQITAKMMRDRDEAEKKAKEEAEAKDKKKNKNKKKK